MLGSMSADPTGAVCARVRARRVFALTALLLLPLLLPAGCRRQPREGGAIRLKLSHITAPGSAWDLGAQRFAELVRERSGGRIEVAVFPQGQLANRDQHAELNLMQAGVIDLSFESSIILALFLDPRFDVFNLPWAFADYAAAHAAVDGPLGAQAREWLAAKGIAVLAAGDNGFRQLTNARRPVRAPDDLAGLRIRVAGSPLFIEIFRALGAAPQTMNFGEVFTALQQGTVDGQENPLSVIETSRLDEVQEHLTLWNYVYDPIFLCIGQRRLGELSAEDQELLRRCAAEAMSWQRQYVADEERRLPRLLAERGMAVVALTAAELEPFRARAESIWQSATGTLGPQLIGALPARAREGLP